MLTRLQLTGLRDRPYVLVDAATGRRLALMTADEALESTAQAAELLGVDGERWCDGERVEPAERGGQ